MKIHTGDTVLVITGKDKGKTGTVTKVLTAKQQIIVQGINMRTRHIKKTTQGAGQKVKYEASMNVSKVMLIDPKSGKPTRVGYKVDEKTGKKVRFAKVSGAVIEGAAKAKPAKAAKGAKKTDDKKEETAADTAKPPVRGPFWGGKKAVTDDASPNEGDATPAAHAAKESEVRHTPIVQRRSRGS